MTTELARAEWDTAYINNLPDSAFAYIEAGGKKDGDGKTVPRSLRHFPIRNAQGQLDAAHVRNALGRLAQSPYGPKARAKVEAAAKSLGIGEPAAASSSTSRAEASSDDVWLRPWFPLEDIRILSRSQGLEYADGRTVEALVAVFGKPAEIVDQQGHYIEEVTGNAFNKAVNDARPQGSRSSWRVGVFYNHGMTLHGTPSDRWSLPVGNALDVRVERAGLLTVTRYADDDVLDAIREGRITGHSFTGKIIRSEPPAPRGGYRPRADGALPHVRRLELGLREYGPTPFPAYSETEVLSVRGNFPITQHVFDAELELEYAEDAADSMGVDTSEVSEAVTDDEPLPDEHSSRQSSDLTRAHILQRIALARRTRPGLERRESE
jgi:phage head maturation protease